MWMAPPEDIARISQFERHVEPGLRSRYPNEPGGAGTFRFLTSVRSAVGRQVSHKPRVAAPAAPPIKMHERRTA
jgi:hypothetical protein